MLTDGWPTTPLDQAAEQLIQSRIPVDYRLSVTFREADLRIEQILSLIHIFHAKPAAAPPIAVSVEKAFDYSANDVRVPSQVVFNASASALSEILSLASSAPDKARRTWEYFSFLKVVIAASRSTSSFKVGVCTRPTFKV